MFEHLKERLQSVQQDFSTGFKSLGEKSKEPKVLRKPRSEDRLLHFSAGLNILHRYEESWYHLHRRTKDCSQAAQLVDGDIVMLSAVWDKRRSALTQLEEQLQGLPPLIRELDSITTSLAELEGDFEEMESRMVYLETLCCQCEQQTVKQQHLKELEAHRKKKRKELHSFEVELNAEHAQKVSHMEQLVQQKLKAKQKEYEQAFHQDVEKYLSSGFLTHREAATASACELDHITVTNTSDQQALDDFLNSSSEDTSLWSGAEETCSSGSLSVGRQRAGAQPPEQQGGEADSEDQGSEADSEEQGSEADSEDQGGEADSEEQGSETDSEDQGGEADSEEQGSETDSEEPLVEADQDEVLPDASL